MKDLLWKDFRENRTVLTAIGLLLLIPYGISIVIAVVDLYRGYTTSWAELLLSGSTIALFLSAGVTSFIAGNAIAGERANRSAEFAAYLPIPRQSAVTSKAIVAISSCLFILLVNFGINRLAAWVQSDRSHDVPVQDLAFFGLPAVVLMFGVAWLFSSFSRSPVIAAASGLVAFLVLIGPSTFSMSHATGRISDSWLYWYCSTSLIAGIGGFVVGVVHYLRRVEP